jgi:hypothetical protein
MALIFFATVSAIVLGALVGITFPEGVPLVIMLVIGTILISIPVTIVSLISAYRLRIVSAGYVIFSIASSFLIAGAGWIIIPFMLNRDINSFFSEQHESHLKNNTHPESLKL